MDFTLQEHYRPRDTQCNGVELHEGWRLKCYRIDYAADNAGNANFAPAVAMARNALPIPAVAAQRPGVGFLILHQGRGVDYLVMAWWDRENELPLRVFVDERQGAGWRPARDSESVCVWDLAVIAFERDAYVRCVLEGQGGLESYLDARFCSKV